VNEFSGLALRPEGTIGPLAVTKGDQVLESLGFKDSSIDEALIGLARIVAVNYLFTYISLLRQKPASESLQPFTTSRSNTKDTTAAVTAKADCAAAGVEDEVDSERTCEANAEESLRATTRSSLDTKNYRKKKQGHIIFDRVPAKFTHTTNSISTR